VFYNNFCQKNTSNEKTIDYQDILKENGSTKTKEEINQEEIDFNLDFEKTDFVNLYKNIELRLYQTNSDISITDKNSNSLVNKKQDLPANLNENGEISRIDNLILLKNQLEVDEKIIYEEKYQKSKIGVSLFILLIGMFALWIPLYKTICESQGFTVKTGHQDYKFQNKKRNLTFLKIFYFQIN
jgi:hypothetical protein